MADPQAVIDGLRSLRAAERKTGEFWQHFARLVSDLCQARSVAVLRQDGTGVSVLASHPAAAFATEQAEVPVALVGLLQRAEKNRFAVSSPTEGKKGPIQLAVTLAGVTGMFLLIELNYEPAHRVSEIMVRAQLIADIPGGGDSVGTEPGTERFTQPGTTDLVLEFLDLLAEVYAVSRFATAAYTLANGLVSRLQTVDQVVIGWSQSGYIRVKAVSHMDRFERRTEIIKGFEAAMEEAFDQGQPITLQANHEPQAGTITLAHQQLVTDYGCSSVFSLPLNGQHDDDGLVVLLLNYQGSFSRPQLEAVHFLTRVLHPRLSQLYEQGQLLPTRVAQSIRRKLATFFGPEHAWLKLSACVVAGFLLYGLVGTLPHRIEGTASLTTEQVRIASAPFDGRVEEASVTGGDLVTAGQTLLTMDREDLLLQQSEVRADLLRNQAEMSRARAVMDLVEAEISNARSAQNEARLKRLAIYLDQSVVASPFDGVVVEGDRQSLLGRPTSKGDVLYRIARLEGLYLEIMVPQADIHYVDVGHVGEFSFQSRPDSRIPFMVKTVIPVASVKDQSGPQFLLKARLEQDSATWWRPGMTGVAKIDNGSRNAFWVIGHGLVDRLRLWLWW